jgi:hypothetical protein
MPKKTPEKKLLTAKVAKKSREDREERPVAK